MNDIVKHIIAVRLTALLAVVLVMGGVAYAAPLSKLHAEPPVINPPKWEYRTGELGWGPTGTNENLAAMGKQGWELCAYIPNHGPVFKRRYYED